MKRIRSSIENKEEQSNLIIEQIKAFDGYQKAKNVAFFYPLKEEINLVPLIKEALKDKVVLLPKTRGENMDFILISNLSELKEGAFHVYEPIGNKVVEDIDLMIVPALAYDKRGYRIGYGKGYYDRFLSRNTDVHTIGVCYKTQVVSSVPNDKYDIQVKEILWKISR